MDGEDFVVAMRARSSWVFSHLSPPESVTIALPTSSAGASTVVSLEIPASRAGYSVVVDIEERMPVRDLPKFASAAHPPLGPSVLVALRQFGVTTSAQFDWHYLLSLWPLMSAARST